MSQIRRFFDIKQLEYESKKSLYTHNSRILRPVVFGPGSWFLGPCVLGPQPLTPGTYPGVLSFGVLASGFLGPRLLF